MWKGLIGSIVVLLLGCQTNPETPKTAEVPKSVRDSMLRDSFARAEMRAIEQEDYFKFWGYRFKISGDFNGDGRIETLNEKIISRLTGKEIYKYCGLKEGEADCWWTWRVNMFREPKCVLECSDAGIRDFATTPDSFSTIGMIFLQNAGDLNGDGTDEILFVEDYGGCDGGGREAQIATLAKGKWRIVKEIETRVDNIPYLDHEAIKEPGDAKSPTVLDYEKELAGGLELIKTEHGKVFFYEYAIEGGGWKPLNIELTTNL